MRDLIKDTPLAKESRKRLKKKKKKAKHLAGFEPMTSYLALMEPLLKSPLSVFQVL